MLTDLVCVSGVSLHAITHLMHTNPDVSQLAHLGAETTTFLDHHAGHGRADLSAIQNLQAGSGWIAEHAFATGQQSWDAKRILVAPTDFGTAMSKMQAAKQLPTSAAGCASELPMSVAGNSSAIPSAVKVNLNRPCRESTNNTTSGTCICN